MKSAVVAAAFILLASQVVFAKSDAGEANLEAHEKICQGLIKDFNVKVQDLQSFKRAEAQGRPLKETILTGTTDSGAICQVKIDAFYNDLSGWASKTCGIEVLAGLFKNGFYGRPTNDNPFGTLPSAAVVFVRDSSQDHEDGIKSSSGVLVRDLNFDTNGKLSTFSTFQKSKSAYVVGNFHPPGISETAISQFGFSTTNGSYRFEGHMTSGVVSQKLYRSVTCNIKK